MDIAIVAHRQKSDAEGSGFAAGVPPWNTRLTSSIEEHQPMPNGFVTRSVTGNTSSLSVTTTQWLNGELTDGANVK